MFVSVFILMLHTCYTYVACVLSLLTSVSLPFLDTIFRSIFVDLNIILITLVPRWLQVKTLCLALKTDRKISVSTRSVFHFCLFVFVFAGSRFRIYGNRRGVFPSVSAGSRFHPKLTRIYSVFHSVLNLYEMCRN
jgi:hypothetical protein